MVKPFTGSPWQLSKRCRRVLHESLVKKREIYQKIKTSQPLLLGACQTCLSCTRLINMLKYLCAPAMCLQLKFHKISTKKPAVNRFSSSAGSISKGRSGFQLAQSQGLRWWLHNYIPAQLSCCPYFPLLQPSVSPSSIFIFNPHPLSSF